MKGIDRLKAQMGGHIKESMGAASVAGVGGPLPATAPGVPSRYEGVTRPKDALTIAVEKLVPDPCQPRKDFADEELAMLAKSLAERGQLQPIRVRWGEAEGSWIIVSGERRWRAARIAGLGTLTAIEAKGTPTADDLLEDQIVENAVRTDLKPIEQANAFKALMDRRGYSGRQLADILHISHMSVQRALALLDLPAAVQEQVEQGALAPATAYEVSKIADPHIQAELAKSAVDEGLKRAEVAEIVQAVKARRPVPTTRPEPVTVDIGDGCTVTIRWKKAGAITVLQALRRAARVVQEQERDGEAA
jgi:ParB family transcriptional regulator, chromosome partitioning protein